jgi:preprotein translocase subunit SecF
MEFFKTNTKIPFMRQRTLAAIFSAFVFIASICTLAINGLNLGLDFSGGSEVTVDFKGNVDITTLRNNVAKVFPKSQVQAANQGSIRVRVSKVYNSQDKQNKQTLAQFNAQLKHSLKPLMPPGATFDSIQTVGPSVSTELLRNGILAVVFSLILTMIYVAIRFEYRFAVSAALALIHDPVLILGVFSMWHLEFTMIVLTALLTVIGYSLNDTIVVYDRVRENFKKMRKSTPKQVMDASINQTLSRTIMTSGLTLLVVIALFLYGGDAVHGFALALMIGIVIGTYSSIYVAGSLAIAFGLTRQSLLSKSKLLTSENTRLL